MADAAHRPKKPDGELVAAALDGDRHAYAALVDRHSRAVRTTVRGHVSQPEAVEDAVQEAFTRGLSRLGSLRDPQRFRPWLLSIARNTATDLRRDLTDVRMDPVDEAGTEGVVVAHGSRLPDEQVELRELTDLVRGCVAALSPRDATALSMVLWLGFGPQEVASALGVTPGAAKVLLHRARRRLADALVREVAVTADASDCDDLRPLLADPVAAARHVRDCGRCQETSRHALGVGPAPRWPGH
jgi:RNA polymerase sigma factor (sigma-70 family)